MAQTGFTPISNYYSATTTNVPTAGNLVAGELALNTADGKLFYKDSGGVVQTLATKATGSIGGSTTQVQYNSSGSLAGSANMVFDGSTLTTLNSAYTGTLTGGTGIVNLGSGQFYKDASGNVGIGTASPASKLDVKAGSGSVISRSTSGVNFKAFYDDGRTTYTSVNYDGVSTVGAQDLYLSSGSNIYFRTNTNSSLVSAMTIDTGGTITIGNTVISGTNGNNFWLSNTTTTSGYNQFAFKVNGTTVGNIQTTSSNTSYLTSSDYRLKEDIAPMTGALATVALLKPVTYKWKLDGKNGQGFIAHELQEVIAEAATGEKDALDAEGNPEYQGIDTSFLVATLTAAIQELKAIIDTQATQITALQAKVGA